MFHGKQCGSCVGVCLQFVSSRQQLQASLAICSQLQLVNVTVWCTLEQCVFLYDTYVKFGSARKCWRKFRCKFYDERAPSRQTIHNLVNKLRTMGLFINKKQNVSNVCLLRRSYMTQGPDLNMHLENY
jgi:hypothetical protein